MAYATVMSLIHTIERILQENRFQFIEWQEQIRFLHDKASLFQSFLQDFSITNSRYVESLEIQIREAAEEAHDVIDSHVSEFILTCNKEKKKEKVIIIKDHLDFQKVIDEFHRISNKVMKKMCSKKDLAPTNFLHAGSSRATHDSKNTAVVGLDEDLLEIKDRLTGQQSKLQIIPIIGMGGIGKTTLAKAVYDDPLTVHHFHIRAWLTISQVYDPSEIVKDLIDQLHGNGGLEDAYRKLKGRRYLVVMDDVWDTKVWDEVGRIFPDDNNGSRVILTTRESLVAMYPNSSGVLHHMRFLNGEMSWNMLHEKAFGGEACPPHLEETGKVIAKRCRGLPLAVAVIGGLLAKMDRTTIHWKYVAENLHSIVATNDDQCLEILSLSYRGLPPHLKACFLYMGAFPEDKAIRVTRLSNLWIAEGFLKPIGCDESLRDVACGYIEDLIDRSLILVHERGANGKPKVLKIHDLLRELCLREAEKEKFLFACDRHPDFSLDATNGYRRFSTWSYLYMGKALKLSLLARSFISDVYIHAWLSHIKFRLLRILDTVIRIDFKTELLEHVNLRYIACVYAGKIPDSISRFWNLQTLISHDHVALPLTIWETSQLRYIKARGLDLPNPVAGSPALQHLETLSGVTDFVCTEEVVERLPNLKKLKLLYSNKSNCRNSYQLNNLGLFQKLENLNCVFAKRFHFFGSQCLPQSLKKLTLFGGEFPWGEMTVIGSLPNLEVLVLKNDSFVGPSWEPNEGEFLRLKVLRLEHMDLQQWTADSSHFPSLCHLFLKLCFSMKKIPRDIGNIMTLKIIEVCYCKISLRVSVEEILKEQQSLGNDDLRVSIS